jgi:hypothetical protein
MNAHAYCLVFLFLVTNINSLSLSKGQQSQVIHLKPPNLSGEHNNVQRLDELSSIVSDNENKIEAINEINPCNGTYIKTNGTTCGLKEIMIGRCHEYQFVKRGLYLSNQT